MTFQARGDEQQKVIKTDSDLTVVLGGAGTGKTTCALAAAAAHLERTTTSPEQRALFLSFSRASVSRIADHSRGILGPYAPRVDISTFHALAYSIVRRFGSLIGKPSVVLVSPPRERLDSRPDAIGYDHLIPLAINIIRSSPAVAAHLRSRWGLVIVDEFQDTGDAQQDLLNEIAQDARLILLGDPNQCIYTFLAADGVRIERITEACRTAGSENTISLPEVSHRDPTGVIPSVARAVLQRDFTSPALTAAIDDERLHIHSGIPLEDEVAVVADYVRGIRADDLGVAVFTHHNDMLAALSDGLEADGIDHEIAGLNDALACALDAQVAMLGFAAGSNTWDDVLLALAVFCTSAQRGKQVPQLARDILDGTGSTALHARLSDLQGHLQVDAPVEDDLGIAAGAHEMVGLTSKSSAWAQAASLLRTMRARATRQSIRQAPKKLIVRRIAAAAQEAAASVLTDVAVDPHEVQLMNLYQTKGREADVTIVVLRQGDFMGTEGEPFPTTSRLLYVVFSRARHRIVVLLVGDYLHPAVEPLTRLA
ncbi:AAA family ATPase [Mycolicibacterium sp. PAM1]|uniref:UvrD-helicase domain-containing protein n=1 Tax=Mycolicibacterium sp. PAM1 TaxID=2853535 RepID=UPI001C3DFABF|nr:UvrD-helicase domain-containing protein [Mycolicibacterium sp. PAM1]MBV5247043.1 AAA family ATPase [Mycolicibacterium sp. PAM1]